MKKTVLLILISLIVMSTAIGQVTISPTSLFLDNKKRFQTVVIMNGSDLAQEIKMDWQFGYPITDEKGAITMVYDDSLTEARYSAADWIRGFPKRFILPAGGRQTIRVTVKAPRKLEAGTYWSRMMTRSSAVSPPVGESEVEGIRAQINFQFNQITSVFYKHGDVKAGLEITDVSSEVNDQELTVLAGYNKMGNSPFLGTMTTSIFDDQAKLVKEQFVFVSIYFNGRHRMEIDVSDLPKGSYDYEISFTGNRTDIPEADIIPAGNVTTRSNFKKL